MILDMTVLLLTVMGVTCLIGSIVWFVIRITQEDERIQSERTYPRAASAGEEGLRPHSEGAGEFTSTKPIMHIEESTRPAKHELAS